MHIPFEQRRENERRIWRAGLVASLVFHVLVFVLFSAGGPLNSPFAAAGPKAGDSRAASGGLQAMNIRIPPPRPIIPPKILLPLLINVQPVEFEDDVRIETAYILGENPGEEGPGLDMGDGKGDGGTAEERRTLPLGTPFDVRLQQQLNTEWSRAGDVFIAKVTDPIIDSDGREIIPAGAEIMGEVVSVRAPDRSGENGSIQIHFNRFFIDGESYPIDATAFGLSVHGIVYSYYGNREGSRIEAKLP